MELHSGALASTGVGILSHCVGQAIGNAAISATETVVSHVVSGDEINKDTWREAAINGAISGIMGAISGHGIAHNNAELKQARSAAFDSWKARNQTLGAVINGTASRASLQTSQAAYKTAARTVRKVAQPLTTNVMFGITTVHSTIFKKMNNLLWTKNR